MPPFSPSSARRASRLSFLTTAQRRASIRLSRAKSVKSLGAVTLATTSLSSLSTLDSDEGGGAGGAGFGARRGRRGSKRMINLSHAALHKMQQRNTITEKAGGSRSNPPHSPPRRSC